MTLDKMPTHGRELVQELISSKRHKSSPDRIDIHRKMHSSGPGSLKVTFQRTCRVTDNGTTNNLPPDMGTFPLFKISDHKDSLPSSMSAKGGYFFPMYQREAMWIRFESLEKFAVKVYVGGVNAISGEPSIETEQTKKRRRENLSSGRTIQDYVVTPQQLWLDGIASQDGKVRQFVAMPLGSGYSVEAQITGHDLIGGMQLEVIPVKEEFSNWAPTPVLPIDLPKPAGTPTFDIHIISLTGKKITFTVSSLHTVYEVKSIFRDTEGVPIDQQRFIFQVKQLEDARMLSDYGIVEAASVQVVLRLRGGGCTPAEMGFAAGGLIKQTILSDENDPSIWDSDHGMIFNIQILNSAKFQAVTGKAAPKTPVTAKAYAKYGLPYYDIYEEKPSAIQGDFSNVDSVAAKDLQGNMALENMKGDMEVIEDTHNPVVSLDQTGKRVGFCPVKLMEKEIIEEFGKLHV